MAKSQGKDRRVAWFENSVHPLLRKSEDEPSDPGIGGFVDPPKHFVPDPITYTGSYEDYHGPGSAWFSQMYGNPRLLDHEGTNVQVYDEPDTPGGASVVKWGGPHWPFRHAAPTGGVKTYENGRQVGVVSVSDRSSGPFRQAQVINPPGDLKREASITAGLGALGLAPQVLGYYPDAAKAPARHKLGSTDDYGEPMYGNYLGNQALHTTHAGNDGFRPVAKWHNWDHSDPEQHVNDLISLWQSGLTSMQRMHQAGYGHGNLLEFKDDHIWYNPESNEVRFTDFGGNDSFGPNDPFHQNSSWGKPEIVENGKKMVRLRDMSGLTNTIFGLMTFGRQPERMKQFEDQARREQRISASNSVAQSAKKQARQQFLENPEEFYETVLKPQGYGTKDPGKFRKFLEALRSSMIDPTVLQNPFLFMDKGNIDYDAYEKHLRNSVSELAQERKSMKKSWFENSVHPALSKRIRMRSSATPPPTHEQLYPPQEAELEDILGPIGLGHLASQYRQHLDGQERRGGARGNHPLVMMSSSAYMRMLRHNEASHRARKTARATETAAVPYAYDERGGSLGGESFKDGQGRKMLVVRDFKPSDEPHEGRNAVASWPYPAGNGLVPVGLMHSHPPSAFSSQPSGSDIGMIRMNHANAPVSLIMYPYGPGTEAAGAGFTDTADNRNGQPVRGSKEALDASAYGRTAHVRALFAELGPDGKPRISTMDPRNIIVYDDRKGGYAFTPDGFGQGIHGPALVPGQHFTADPETTETGHLATPGGKVGRAGSDLVSRRPAIARTFGAGKRQIMPRLRGDSQQAPGKIAARRETAKSWFENSVHPALRKSPEPPIHVEGTPGRIWAPAGTALFLSPDPEINRRVAVANDLALTHSLLDYQDPNDFVDHEDPRLRAHARFLLHHAQRDTAAHPIDDSYLESVRDIYGQEDHDYAKAHLDSLPDKEGIEKHNQELMDTYVEKPAHAAVRRALAAGYSPHQSDAFGNWSRKGVLAYPFPMYTPGTGADRSGGYTFFPSTHEDFVNAGVEPPPGIGHDSTPTRDLDWWYDPKPETTESADTANMSADKGDMMKSGRNRIIAQVRKEEERLREKIHKEEKAEKRGVRHEADHGIKAHEDKVMKLIVGKAYTKDQAATIASIDRYLRKAETDDPGNARAASPQAPKPVANGKFSAPPPQGFQLRDAIPASKPDNSLLPVVTYNGKEYGVGSVMSGIGNQIARYTAAKRAANPAPAPAPNPNVGVGAQGVGAMATATANALTGGLWSQGARLLGQQSTPTAQTGGGVTATRSPTPSAAPAAPAAPAVPAPAARIGKAIRSPGSPANHDADPFTKSQKDVLDRMDRWKRETEERLMEEEDKLADRIHRDHTGPGVPKFVGKYTHGVKQHEKRLKRVIDKLRDDEEAEVREEMDKLKCSRCGKDPCVCDKVRKAQSVLSTPKARISARDVDDEGHLSDAAELRTASSDQGRRAESRMARRSTMKPNNIREVNRRQIDRDISRPGSRANIAHGRKVKSDEQASGMKTKGDLPTPVPPDPYRGGTV